MTEQPSPDTLATATDAPLAAFSEAVFGHMARADQRRWALAYLEGLLKTPGRKSVRRLAASVSGSPTAAMSLQQFVNASPWDWAPARQELTRLAERHLPVRAWTIGTAILPKRGDHSCGVHRRFVPAAGRTISCQVGIGLFVSAEPEILPVDWRLLLPEQWTEDSGMRRRAKIPESLGCHPIWAQVLNLVDTMASRTSRPRVPVVADMSDCNDVEPLLHGLARRGHEFVVGVPGTLQAIGGSGRPATGARPGEAALQQPRPALDLARHARRSLSAGAPAHRQARLVSQPVRLPGLGHTFRLFGEWRRPADAAPRLWVTNLLGPAIDQLVGLARLSQGTAATIDALEQDFGLLDFEGRSFPGWHHHMTLSSAAYAYSTLSRYVVHGADGSGADDGGEHGWIGAAAASGSGVRTA